MPLLTRRRFLGSAAGLAAAATAAALMPPHLRRALATMAGAPRPQSLRDVRHVVLLLQENRSFDHYFGTLAGVRGFADPSALQLTSGRSVFFQPDAINPDGHVLPFHLDTRTTSAEIIPSTSHEWSVQHAAWNHGAMDGWLAAHRKVDGADGPYCMGYYERSDLPFHFALADMFTVCDAYYCSVLGPTYPNRVVWMTGTIDPDARGGGPIANNVVPADGFSWTTYPERLEQAGVSWQVYRTEDRLKLDVLRDFRQFRDAAKGSALYTQGGMEAGSDGQFEYDAIHDKLPAVAWVIPPIEQSEHPDYMLATGAAFVASKLDAIAANPDVWAKTVFILGYDENDGLFDHVPPPVPPAGTPQEFVRGQPIGAGFRVPCMVISPWTVGGWVCSEPYDHTSVLRFLERFTGVREPNISAWRRQTFGDLTRPLRFDQTDDAPPALPGTKELLARAEYATAHWPRPALPGTRQRFPVQEPGVRKRVR